MNMKAILRIPLEMTARFQSVDIAPFINIIVMIIIIIIMI